MKIDNIIKENLKDRVLGIFGKSGSGKSVLTSNILQSELTKNLNKKIIFVSATKNLYIDNKFFNYRYYSIGGNGVHIPSYYKTLIGTPINKITEFSESSVRFISGDLLSGNETKQELSIDYYDEILSVIETSQKREFLGWLKPGIDKYSLTRTFLSKIIS